MGVLLEVLLIRGSTPVRSTRCWSPRASSLMLQQLARDVFGARTCRRRAPELLTGNVAAARRSTVANNRLVHPRAWRPWPSSRAHPGAAAHARWAGGSAPSVQNRDLADVRGHLDRAGRPDDLLHRLRPGRASPVSRSPCSARSARRWAPTYIIDAFLVVVVGGIGQLKGAVIVAFALGVLQATGRVPRPPRSIAKVIVFVGIVAFLQWRPQGLFTLRTRSLA